LSHSPPSSPFMILSVNRPETTLRFLNKRNSYLILALPSIKYFIIWNLFQNSSDGASRGVSITENHEIWLNAVNRRRHFPAMELYGITSQKIIIFKVKCQDIQIAFDEYWRLMLCCSGTNRNSDLNCTFVYTVLTYPCLCGIHTELQRVLLIYKVCSQSASLQQFILSY
jgi:hypothetical protein